MSEYNAIAGYGPITKSNGISVSVEPFTRGNDFTLIFMNLQEHIGGEPAGGVVELRYQKLKGEELEKKYKKQNAIHISLYQTEPKTDSYDIIGFITSRSWVPGSNTLQLQFICVPLVDKKCKKDFFSTTKTAIHKEGKIKEVLEKTWRDSSHIRFGQDASESPLGPQDFMQERETDLQFMKKLAYGYMRDTVFGFGLEGFFLKKIQDTDRLTGDPEPCRLLIGGTLTKSDDAITQAYNSKLYQDIENPCVDTEHSKAPDGPISKNFNIEILKDDYRIIRNDVEEFQNNYRHNTRLMGSSLYRSISVRYTVSLPPWHLGDTFYYAERGDIKKVDDGGAQNIYMCSENEIFYSAEPGRTDEDGNSFSVVSILRGISDISGKILSCGPDSDPGENEDIEYNE